MKRGRAVRTRPSKLRDGPEAVARREAEDRKEVERTWRTGLADRAAAKLLHMAPERYAQLREALKLPRNPGREE